MDMAQNELAAAVAAPAPVPAPIPAPAPATILVALTGWSPSTIAELKAAGVSEVSADPRELVYMPAPVPVRAPPPTMAPAPVRLAAPAAPVPVRAPHSTAWDAAVDHYLSAPPAAVLPRPARRSGDDMMFDLQVKKILCCLEDFNNGVLEDDNDNDGAACRRK